MPRNIQILDYGNCLYVRPWRQTAKPKLAEVNSVDGEAFERSSMCREMYKRNNLPISLENNSSSIVDGRFQHHWLTIVWTLLQTMKKLQCGRQVNKTFGCASVIFTRQFQWMWLIHNRKSPTFWDIVWHCLEELSRNLALN